MPGSSGGEIFEVSPCLLGTCEGPEDTDAFGNCLADDTICRTMRLQLPNIASADCQGSSSLLIDIFLELRRLNAKLQGVDQLLQRCAINSEAPAGANVDPLPPPAASGKSGKTVHTEL